MFSLRLTACDLHFVSIGDMARPRKNESEKRVQPVTIRFTAEEYRRIEEYAQGSIMSPANWMRYKVFTGKFPPLRVSPVEVSLYKELRRIGVNLNQGTHKLNAGEFPKDYLALQLELLAMLTKIYKLLADDRQSGNT
jgi:hypothetical protein